jgi:hypothetical protein
MSSLFSPLIRLTTLPRSARVGKALLRNALKPQSTSNCIGDHMALARAMTDHTGKKWTTISSGHTHTLAVDQALDQGPVVLTAMNIAQPGSKYTTHHAVTIVEKLEDGYVLVADLDDTLKRTEPATEADFFYKVKLDDLLKKATPCSNTTINPMLRQPSAPSQYCAVM